MASEGNATNLTNNGENQHYEMDHDAAILMFLFGSCAVGAMTRRVLQGFNLRLPYTVVLLVLGILFGLLSGRFASLQVYTRIVNTDPHLILSVFLPVLIFESAFAMEVHTFLKAFVQVVILAIPGLALASFMTAVLGRYLFTYDWDWNIAMMFGAILSATDPVAVVALLRDLGASKKLATVIEGEALLNDGAAIVFFNVFLKLTTSEAGYSGGEIVVYFIRVAIGGPFVGFIMAKITLFWLSKIFNDALVEITITLASTYVTYYVVEVFFDMSGVLAVVVLGLAMSSERTSISPEVEQFLERFWETLAYLANTLIFIIVGIVIAEKAIFEIHGIDWFYMFSLYFGCFVIRYIEVQDPRAFVIAVFSPVLKNTGYGLNWKEGCVMTWGGLRGAVGLALALQVAHHDRIDQEKVGVRVLIHVSGVVFLTLLVNATTIYGLLRVLGMSDLSPAKRMAMANALRYMKDMREKTLNMLKTDRFLADAEWETVEKQTDIEDPYKTTDEEAQVDDSLDIKQNSCCPECDATLPIQYTRKELREMTNEAILRMLKAEKMGYWRQFEQGMLSREATRKLQECTEVAADKKGKFIDIEEIKKSWEMPSVYPKLKRLVKRTMSSTVVAVDKESRMGCLVDFFQHKWFRNALFALIVVDMINIAMTIVSEYADQVFLQYKNVFRSLNLIFVCIYSIEVVLKLVVHNTHYFQSPWNVLSLVIVIIGIPDIVQNFVLPYKYGELHGAVHIVAVAFTLLRAIRVIRLLEPLQPTIFTLIKRRMSQHLSYGFDVGRGFVAGEEEVRKLIEHMSDHKDIAKTLKQHSDSGRLDVIRCLGMLSKQHPDIALSIKTRQAIRSVLNQLRDGLHELMSDGILEESEGAKLEKVVEEKMKRLQSAPPTLPIPPPDKMLLNVSWLRNNPDLIEYVKEKSKLLTFDYDDTVMHEGEAADGIYIIVSGMVRLETSNPSGKPIVALQEKPSGHSLMQIKTYVLDFMTSGNIIGEMGLLTHKPRSATVVCETSVQMLFISQEDMRFAIAKFNDGDETLEYRLWHVCANRIAVNVLMKQASFQGWTKEKIKLRLENSYIAEVDNESFTVDSSMSDVVLINGKAKNPFDEEIFEGPCYIPWTVFKLDLMPERHTLPIIILVVPNDAGGMHAHGKKQGDQQKGHGAFINSLSQLCLKHASKHRTNVESKWKQKVQNAKSMGTLFGANKIKTDEEGGLKPHAENGGLPGSTLGQMQSSPGRTEGGISNDGFRRHSEPDSSSSGGSHSTADEFKLDIKITAPISDSKAGHKKHSAWQLLKRRFSHHDHPHHARHETSLDSLEILPDDLDYIEGGDIVLAEHSPPIATDQGATPSSSDNTAHSFHSLEAVTEEDGKSGLTEVAVIDKVENQSKNGNTTNTGPAVKENATTKPVDKGNTVKFDTKPVDIANSGNTKQTEKAVSGNTSTKPTDKATSNTKTGEKGTPIKTTPKVTSNPKPVEKGNSPVAKQTEKSTSNITGVKPVEKQNSSITKPTDKAAATKPKTADNSQTTNMATVKPAAGKDKGQKL